MAIRIKSRRSISLDDYFLLFGLTCLTGATVLLLKYTRLIYMTEAVRLLQTGTANIRVIFTLEDIFVMANVSKVVDAVVCLTWTATFAVKASFLALFRVLIRRISKRITIYYWVVVGCTGVTWAFMMSESFIFCSTFGLGSSKCSLFLVPQFLTNWQGVCDFMLTIIFFWLVKCLAHTDDLLYLNVAATIFDIITDMMSKSLPASIYVHSPQIRWPKRAKPKINKLGTKLTTFLSHSQSSASPFSSSKNPKWSPNKNSASESFSASPS